MMQHRKNKGFTLIELLITMLIGLIIMAGMTSVFISQTRTASMLKNKTEAMGDLFLASQIMQSELRGAKGICWNAALSTIVYQPIDSTAACGGAASASNGAFELRPASSTKPTPYICWTRPNNGSGCQELIRGLPAATGGPSTGGLNVTPSGVAPAPVIYTVDLKSLFHGQDNQMNNLGLTFKVWARNK